MALSGIVAEFNPFHSGHEYLIKKAKEKGNVVCVMSGNFVQRGDTAVFEKRIRAKAALKAGADLIIELPVSYSLSTAQNFALGAVYLLKNAGCDRLVFGSESGDTEKIIKTADIISSEKFSQRLSFYLKEGITFASARQKAAEELFADGEILKSANDNLATEYIAAAKKIGFDCEFEAVKRIGALHDSKNEDEFVSASLLREKLISGDFSFCKKYMPCFEKELINENTVSDIKRLERAILSVLRSRPDEFFGTLPDLSEGVENKLKNAVKVANSTDELYNEIKVKRYTMARIRRLVLSAFLGADGTFFMKTPPYMRILGFSEDGERILKNAASVSEIPVITRVSQINGLGEDAKRLFETECRATDLFALSLKEPFGCGLEYTSKFIKTE